MRTGKPRPDRNHPIAARGWRQDAPGSTISRQPIPPYCSFGWENANQSYELSPAALRALNET